MKTLQYYAGIAFPFALMAFPLTGYGQLVVTASSNAAALADSLKTGSVSVSNASLTGNTSSTGFFTKGQTTNLRMQNGIMLSTGKCNESGFSASYAASSNLGNNGYNLLSTLSGLNTYDAAVIEFDAVPMYDTLSLNYIFASEDYPENVGMVYFDPFGVFVSGANPKGGNYSDQNFALIPNTNKIISINTINDTTNWQYYTSNVTGATIVFDGFTKEMQVKIPVKPGSTYRLKIGVADGGDYIYDTEVFLKNHSLMSYGPSALVSIIENKNTLQIIGNPLQEKSYLQFFSNSNEIGRICIFDTKGSAIYQFETPLQAGKMQQIPLNPLGIKPGIYTLQLCTKAGNNQVRFLVP